MTQGCVKNASEPRTLRIVFSIAYCQQHLPMRLVSATTKSRWKFYAKVQRLSFHTASNLVYVKAFQPMLGLANEVVSQPVGQPDHEDSSEGEKE